MAIDDGFKQHGRYSMGNAVLLTWRDESQGAAAVHRFFLQSCASAREMQKECVRGMDWRAGMPFVRESCNSNYLVFLAPAGNPGQGTQRDLDLGTQESM